MKLLLMSNGKVGKEIAMWVMAKYPEDIGTIVTVVDNEINQCARDKCIPNLVFQSENQVLDDLSEFGKFDLGILAWWPNIISPRIMALTANGFINTHPSFLPYNRGKHYNFWALIEQVPFGVSLHFITSGIDDGDIVVQQRIAYDWEDTGESLYNKASSSIVELFESTYPNIRNGNIQRIKQDLSKGSFHHSKEINNASNILLDNSYTARELLNLLRARTFTGHPACSFEDAGEVYEVHIKIRRKNTDGSL
jgi:methionyl-tRNA formyltransferase